jgi:hypothetical protein
MGRRPLRCSILRRRSLSQAVGRDDLVASAPIVSSVALQRIRPWSEAVPKPAEIALAVVNPISSRGGKAVSVQSSGSDTTSSP